MRASMLRIIGREIGSFLANVNAGALAEIRTPELDHDESEIRMERLLLLGALLFKCGGKGSLRSELLRTRDAGQR